jgi:hypothetical protein
MNQSDEIPQNLTLEELIAYVQELRREDEEPGYIEDLYLDKLRNLEMDRLSNNR